MKKTFRRIMALALSAALILTSVLTGIVIPAEAWSPTEHKELSRQASADGQVLLENPVIDEAAGTKSLPIAKGTTVAMFGRAMINYVRGGGGSGNTNVEYTRNILQGMQIKETEGKIKLVPELVDFYTEQVTTNGITDDAKITITDDVWNAAKAATETAVVTIGRRSSEGSDRSASKGDYYLSDAEYALITKVAAEFENTIVVLNIGAVMDTSWIKGTGLEEEMNTAIPGLDAVLVGWQGGMEGGLATADILVGDVNPSGKTVDTWAKDYSYYPSSSTFKQSTSYVNYTEDIFVGYRYFETIPGAAEKVNYEFGYGLSYTTFDTVVNSVEIVEDEIVVTATVTNTGSVAGKQVVQVYFSAPRGDLTKPAKELAAFDKTGLLEPGKSETLVMSFPISDMSSYDDTGVIQKSAYVMEAGDYTFFVGNSIREGKYVDKVYNLPKDIVVEQLTEYCSPSALKQRMIESGKYVAVTAVSEEELHHTVAAEGKTTVEMEAYINGTDTLRVESFYDNDLNRHKCLAYMNAVGKFAEYELTAEADGQYAIYMCYANGHPTKTNCVSVSVNGELQTKATFDAPQTGDGDGADEWYNFVLSEEPMLVNLHEGVNLLRFTANIADGPNYDYMIIERVGEIDGAYARKVKAEGINKFEAEGYEEAITGTKGTSIRQESFTYADGSAATCVSYMNYRGNGVKYYINVEKAGQYKLVLNGANGRAAYNFKPQVKVEPEEGNEELFSQLITAVRTCGGDSTIEGLPDGWYGFADLAPIYINLPEGNCVLSISAQTASFVNLDYFTLEYVGEATTRGTSISSTEATVVEAESYVSAGWPVSGYPNVTETAPETAGEYAGITCTAHVNYVGNYLTWWLYAEEAGSYEVTLNYANGYEDYTFAPKVTVNDKEFEVSIETAATRDDAEGGSGNRYYVFKDAPSFIVELEEGLNVFTTECVEADVFPNLNTLTFKYLSGNRVVSAKGTTKIEAESFDAYNGTAKQNFTAPDGSTGTSIAMATRGRWVEYNLYVEEAGAYDLVMTGANGRAAYTFNSGISVNGEDFPVRIYAERTCSGSETVEGLPSGWFTFAELPAASINLPAGEVTLRMICSLSDTYPNVDFFTLKKTGETVERAITVTANTTFEAENYHKQNGNVNVETFGDDEACVAYMNGRGRQLQYKLNVAQAGIYEVVLKAANGKATYNFMPGIAVLHDEYPDTNWSLISAERTCGGDDTGLEGLPDGWYTFDDLAPLTIALPEGECTLQFTAPIGSYPNLDTITLTRVSDYELPQPRSAERPPSRLLISTLTPQAPETIPSASRRSPPAT